MKITDIRTIPLSFRASNPCMSAASFNAARNALIVEIETDSGLTGIAEAGAAGGPLVSTATVIEQELKPLLIGQDPLMIERLWQLMFARTRQHGRRGIVMHAISGIDIALWDIAGKAAGLPLYKLFGAYTDQVEVYASGGFYQRGKDIGALTAEVESYVARGFRAMKMKIGRYDFTGTNFRQMLNQPEVCVVTPEEDIARVAAVRAALGPNRRLMADANCVWSPATAISMGKALEPYNLFWLEEPVATDDIEGSAAVAAALTTSIAGYETEVGLYGYRELITRRAIDIAQPDLVWSGGFTECRRIAAFAHAHNMMLAPHCFSSALLFVAALHFAASIPNGLIVEWDQTEHALRTELLNEPFDYNGSGMMRVPDGPGLGVSLNRDALERYRVR
jgi:L-alanine-DL-glutamate epimerase-like enolase superfamily enzyme